MLRMPTLRTSMTPFPYSIDGNAPVAHAKDMMEAHDIRHLPVTEAGKLVGVISERDILRSLYGRLQAQLPEDLLVRDVCVLEAYIVELSERLDTVLLYMAESHIGSALVVRHGKLAGIFTATDACRAFGEFLRTQFPPGDNDEAA
jgi:acetoin utilization protein AcuB